MSVRLFASGPCTIVVGGSSVRLNAGDRITISKVDAENALQSYAKSRLVVVSETEDEEPVKLEPEPTGAFKAPVLGLSVDNPETVQDEVQLPFSLDSHWRVVVSYLRSKEEANEISLKELRYIKEKFKDYNSVQKECDRIIELLFKGEVFTNDPSTKVQSEEIKKFSQEIVLVKQEETV